jgi:hypothetical protein
VLTAMVCSLRRISTCAAFPFGTSGEDVAADAAEGVPVGEVGAVELDERRYEVDAAADGVVARGEEHSPITCHLVADNCVGVREQNRRGGSRKVEG